MLIALVAFVFLRAAVVPKSFGQYGHYRGDAIAEVAARPVAHAGHEVCEACHTDVVDQKKLGRHAGSALRSLPRAAGQARRRPCSVKPPKLDTAVLCARCHEANAAKPKVFPQVATADHSGGLACNTCHQPHRPKIEDTGQNARRRQKNNGHHSPSPARPVARGCGRLGIRSAPARPRPLPTTRLTEHWWGMLIDIPKCIGCGNCVRACAEENDVPDGYFRTWIERYHVTD